MIHKFIAFQNAILNQSKDGNASVIKDHRENRITITKVNGAEPIGELVKEDYNVRAIIKWHIDFHLKRKSNPDPSLMTKDHQAYLKYLKSASNEIEEK